MALGYQEVLETFSEDKGGEGAAWDATAKYARMLVRHEAVDRLAIGVRSLLNEIGEPQWAVVLVQRRS